MSGHFVWLLQMQNGKSARCRRHVRVYTVGLGGVHEGKIILGPPTIESLLMSLALRLCFTYLLNDEDTVWRSGHSLPSGQWPCKKALQTGRLGSTPKRYSRLRKSANANEDGFVGGGSRIRRDRASGDPGKPTGMSAVMQLVELDLISISSRSPWIVLTLRNHLIAGGWVCPR